MRIIPALLAAAAVALPAAAQAAPQPAPVPPEPPAAAPHVAGYHFSGDHNEVIRRRDGAGRTVVVARDGRGGWVWTGRDRPPQVLAFHDGRGRDVVVYADHPVSRDEAEALMTRTPAGDERTPPPPRAEPERRSAVR